jgi:magnesium-transporting ATPase (P-type)
MSSEPSETVVQILHYGSTAALAISLLSGIASIVYQGRALYKKSSKPKTLFFFQQIDASLILVMRILIFYLGITMKPALIVYTYLIFVESTLRCLSLNEIMKLFAPISTWITRERVNGMHLLLLLMQLSTLGGILTYHIFFSYPTQDNSFARWFRIGSVMNTIIQIIFMSFCYLTMGTLMKRHSRAAKSKVLDQERRERRLLKWLLVIVTVYVSSFGFYFSGVLVDGPPGSNRNKAYQSLAQMHLNVALWNSVVNPFLFDAIVNVRFDKPKETVQRLIPSLRKESVVKSKQSTEAT